MRSSVVAFASSLLAGSLLLSGCSIVSGGDDAPKAKKSSAAPSRGQLVRCTQRS